MKPQYYTEDFLHTLKALGQLIISDTLQYFTTINAFEHFEHIYTLHTWKCNQIITPSHQISLSHSNQQTTIICTTLVSNSLQLLSSQYPPSKGLNSRIYPNPKRQTHSRKLSSNTINLTCSCNREVHSHTQQKRTYLRLRGKMEELQYLIPNMRSLIATHSTRINQDWAQKHLQNNLKPKAIRWGTAHVIESERQTTDYIPKFLKIKNWTRILPYSCNHAKDTFTF